MDQVLSIIDEFHLVDFSVVSLSANNGSMAQVNLFEGAGLIIASHSSQLLNLLFTHPGAAVVRTRPRPSCYILADLLYRSRRRLPFIIPTFGPRRTSSGLTITLSSVARFPISPIRLATTATLTEYTQCVRRAKESALYVFFLCSSGTRLIACTLDAMVVCHSKEPCTVHKGRQTVRLLRAPRPLPGGSQGDDSTAPQALRRRVARRVQQFLKNFPKF